MGRGLAGHPRCVRVDNGYDKTRLFTPIRSKTTTLPRCGRHHSAQRGRSSSARRGDESAGTGSHRSCSSNPERVRLLQPLLPHPQKSWWPATYFRSQTPESRPDKKVDQDDHIETDPLANTPRGLVHVAGSERRILSHPGSPPSQTIFEIRIRGGGILIQGPPVWAVPGSPHFYVMYGSGSLPSVTDGNSHPQLPQRLAHSGPVRGSFNIAQDPPPQPLRSPEAQGQLCHEHAVTQPMSFVPGDSYRLSADDSNCLSGTSHDNSVPRGLLQRKDRPPAQGLPENAGPYGSGFASTSVGPASHAAHPVLAEAEGSICGLASRSPLHNGDSGLCMSPDPLEGTPLAEAGCDLRHGTQKEGCHDRCFKQRLVSTVRGQTDLRSLVRKGVGSAHQLPRNASSVPCLSILPTGHKGTPCANTLRQQVRGVIHKSPGRPHLEAPLHAGERPSCLGSDQSALTEGDACAGQDEPRSGHVVKEQRLLRRMDATPARGSENLGSLWQSSSRPLCLRRQLSLPNVFHEEHGCPGPRVAQPPALCVPSNRSATTGTQTSQGTMAQASSNSPPLEEPAVGVRVIPAARSSPVAHSLETGPPLSSEWHAVASTARVMGQSPFCLICRLRLAKQSYGFT